MKIQKKNIRWIFRTKLHKIEIFGEIAKITPKKYYLMPKIGEKSICSKWSPILECLFLLGSCTIMLLVRITQGLGKSYQRYKQINIQYFYFRFILRNTLHKIEIFREIWQKKHHNALYTKNEQKYHIFKVVTDFGLSINY